MVGFVISGGRQSVLRRGRSTDSCSRLRIGVADVAVGDRWGEAEKLRVRRVGTRQDVRCSLAGSIVQAGSTVAGLAVLALTILVHETGHYLAARSRGIRVQNFSVGFGPKLLSYTPKGSETEFTLRAIPLGGYVAFPQATSVDEETGEEKDLEDPDLLPNRPIQDRALVISAGVVANVVLAWSALFISVSSFGLPVMDLKPGVLVSQIVDVHGNGAKAGMRQGDIILSVDGVKIARETRSAANVAQLIRTSQGRELLLELQRGDSILDLPVKPQCCTPEGDSVLGVQLSARATVQRTHPAGFDKSVELTNREFMRLFRGTLSGLGSIITNFGENSKNVAGPIGVVSMGAELAKNDRAALLSFAADISMNLAIINSLPLPALDGGQMFFLLAEAARGTPVSSKVQDTVNRTALLMFLAFSGVVLFGDLEKLRIFQGLQQLFG